MACPAAVLFEAQALRLGPAPRDAGRCKGLWPGWNENPMAGFSQTGTQRSVAQGQVYSLSQLKVRISESTFICGYQSKYTKVTDDINLDVCAQSGTSAPKKNGGGGSH